MVRQLPMKEKWQMKNEGMIMKWKGVKISEGRETSEDGRGKGGKTVVNKIRWKRDERE